MPSTSTPWRLGAPPAPGWFVSDGDPDLRRYWDGARWSAPCHADDLHRIGERIRSVPAEPRTDPIEWRE